MISLHLPASLKLGSKFSLVEICFDSKPPSLTGNVLKCSTGLFGIRSFTFQIFPSQAKGCTGLRRLCDSQRHPAWDLSSCCCLPLSFLDRLLALWPFCPAEHSRAFLLKTPKQTLLTFTHSSCGQKSNGILEPVVASLAGGLWLWFPNLQLPDLGVDLHSYPPSLIHHLEERAFLNQATVLFQIWKSFTHLHHVRLLKMAAWKYRLIPAVTQQLWSRKIPNLQKGLWVNAPAEHLSTVVSRAHLLLFLQCLRCNSVVFNPSHTLGSIGILT